LNTIFDKRLNRLVNSKLQHLLADGLKGVEKECLRINPDGKIAQTPHPTALGSALTHPHITTDYSEALLEFITEPFANSTNVLSFLRRIHQFVYRNIDHELLLASSMPCAIFGDASIPIAEYGTSNIGLMKHVYRRGLDHRYGRSMQTIAGVHFNYSVPEAFWPAFQQLEQSNTPRQSFIAEQYFAMIRNFHRLGWLILYLFGASPALCKSFLEDRKPLHNQFSDFDPFTFYNPHATSLRMSDIGYKNSNQAQLNISYNNLNGYIESLTRAIETPHPDYQKIGIRKDGEYLQLNENVLQIENEYYSNVRPKQIARSGEKPTLALKRRGVRYVEIRSLDIDLFSDIGVSDQSLCFLEALLLTCLLGESPGMGQNEVAAINKNLLLVAHSGRDPELLLDRGNGSVRLRDWALEICESMVAICDILDTNQGGRRYTDALEAQLIAIREPEHTPSARILNEMRSTGESFAEYSLRLSRQYALDLQNQELGAEKEAVFRDIARQSIDQQRQLEQDSGESFEHFLDRYFNQK